jgi:hypothetical protein
MVGWWAGRYPWMAGEHWQVFRDGWWTGRYSEIAGDLAGSLDSWRALSGVPKAGDLACVPGCLVSSGRYPLMAGELAGVPRRLVGPGSHELNICELWDRQLWTMADISAWILWKESFMFCLRRSGRGSLLRGRGRGKGEEERWGRERGGGGVSLPALLRLGQWFP